MAEDLFEEFVDVGAKAMLASMRGDTKEYERLLEKGREIKIELDKKMMDDLINDHEKEIRAKRKKRKAKEPPRPPVLTSNLGDALRAAGVIADSKKTGG